MGVRASAFFWPYADIQYGFLDRELGFDNLHALAAQGRHQSVRKLLRQGMDPNARRLEDALGAQDDERGDSPMICAARGALVNKDKKRHLQTLEVLLQFGANVNQPNLHNQTPLYIACERNVLRVATWLLQHGADVNINCKTGVSPLMCAYQNQNATLATLLLEKGAVVIRPPTIFSSIKFPELADELKNVEVSDDESATTLHSTLQQYVDHEAERRARVVESAHEAQRLEDQRVYREQLAKDGAKRKARRRRKRLETQQRRNLPPVKALDTATDTSEIESSLNNKSINQGASLLLWEKRAMVNRTRSSERPTWVAKRIYCTERSENDVMHECKKLHDSIEQERSRCIRSIVTAPHQGFDRHELPYNVRPETASF